MAVAGMAAPAWGQHALDRNLQVGSGGVNPQRPDMAAEMRFRNAVVTGNAPGGLSFRGDVGYMAPGEFTGRQGADDTFSFRRDSMYSGMGGVGIRGTDALQYQFALTTGRAPPPGLVGAPAMVPRGASGATAGAVRAEPMDFRGEGMLPSIPPRWSAGDTAEDTRGLSLAALRTPSAFVTTRTFQPTILGTGVDPDGVPMGVTASVLRGVSYGPMFSGRELDRREGEPARAEFDGLRPRGADERPERIEMGAEAPRTPYEEVVRRMAERRDPGAVEDPTMPGRDVGDPDIRGGSLEFDWRNRLTDLRLQLQEPTRRAPLRIGHEIDPHAPAIEAVEQEGAEATEFSPETVEMLRRAGRIDVLAAPGIDAYAAHMEAGQRYLADGRYFDAEERFTAALSVRRGDPMAVVGRIHAALGAGMFLSAAINLRDVLTTNPELAGVRYSAELLPRAEHMQTVQERLMELIRTRPMQAREAGMLLAYVGFQRGDEAVMNRGLATMEGTPAEGEPLTPADEQMKRLAALLREVWADEGDR